MAVAYISDNFDYFKETTKISVSVISPEELKEGKKWPQVLNNNTIDLLFPRIDNIKRATLLLHQSIKLLLANPLLLGCNPNYEINIPIARDGKPDYNQDKKGCWGFVWFDDPKIHRLLSPQAQEKKEYVREEGDFDPNDWATGDDMKLKESVDKYPPVLTLPTVEGITFYAEPARCPIWYKKELSSYILFSNIPTNASHLAPNVLRNKIAKKISRYFINEKVKNAISVRDGRVTLTFDKNSTDAQFALLMIKKLKIDNYSFSFKHQPAHWYNRY